MNVGKVYLVGAGPGAPDLITVRAAAILKSADIVFYDALVHEATLAIAANAKHVGVGKRRGKHSTAQRFINKRLIDAAHHHGHVVRLKGGDPMLFGRAQEEITALRAAGIPFEVVPGVTSAFAASAELGISLTQRGVARSVAFVTPRTGEQEQSSDWARTVMAADTAAIYMGVGEAATIAATLLARGMPPGTPVAVVVNATLVDRREILLQLRDLPQLAHMSVDGPAVILLGEVYSPALADTAQALSNLRCA